jgi:hypothetical protein
MRFVLKPLTFVWSQLLIVETAALARCSLPQPIVAAARFSVECLRGTSSICYQANASGKMQQFGNKS